MVCRMIPDFGDCASDRHTTSQDHFKIGNCQMYTRPGRGLLFAVVSV